MMGLSDDWHQHAKQLWYFHKTINQAFHVLSISGHWKQENIWNTYTDLYMQLL